MSGRLIAPALVFFPGIVLAIWSLLCFHTNLKICSSSVKNAIGNLGEIELNLIALGSIVILTVLILPIQESQKCPSTRACRLLGRDRSQCQSGDLQESSAEEYTTGPPPLVFLPLQWATADPHLQETLQDLQVGLVQALMESLLCPGPQGSWNLSPPVLWYSCTPAKFSGGSSPPMPDPQAGSLMWAQTSLLWENLCRCGI